MLPWPSLPPLAFRSAVGLGSLQLGALLLRGCTTPLLLPPLRFLEGRAGLGGD